MVRERGVGMRGRAARAEQLVTLIVCRATAIPYGAPIIAHASKHSPSQRQLTRSRVRGHLGGEDPVGVDNRLAALDLIDVCHAFGHLSADRVFAVDKRRIGKAAEELTVA